MKKKNKSYNYGETMMDELMMSYDELRKIMLHNAEKRDVFGNHLTSLYIS